MTFNDLINHWQDIPLWVLILWTFIAAYIIKSLVDLFRD